MTVSDLALLNLASTKIFDNSAVPEILHILRKHLGMDIAFLGEFVENQREIKLVDADGDASGSPMQPGLCTPSEESYCKLIIDGKLPNLIQDVNDYPLAAALPVTKELNIRSYISAPIYLEDGTVYGTLCCYSHTPEPSLNKRDLSMIQACAEMTAKQIDKQRSLMKQQHEAKTRIESILASDKILVVYQPIYYLSHQKVVGFEALSRFQNFPDLRPDTVFNEAHEVGLGSALEIKTIRLALEGLSCIDPNVYVAVNVSPYTVLDPAFSDALAGIPLARMTLEITEHAAVDKYQEIKAALGALRDQGMQLAVDDAGAGFSSFRHILELSPDRIKLDVSLTRNVDTDPSRRALVAAFVRFAKDIDRRLIAEGVETAAELNALRDMGIEKVQGNYVGRPTPLHELSQGPQ